MSLIRWIDSCYSSCKVNGGPFLKVVARGG